MRRKSVAVNSNTTNVSIFVAILLLLTACSTVEPTQSFLPPTAQPLTIPTEQVPTAVSLLNNPEPVVDFIDYLEPYPGAHGTIAQLICIQVRTDVIYELGDVATFGVNSTRFHLFVDGVELPFAQANLMERDVAPKYDPVAKAPYYEGSQTGCLPLSIAPGLHIANISAVSSSGKKYMYSWAFRADTVGASAPLPHEKWLGEFYATVSARVEHKQYDDPFTVQLATQIAKQPTPTPSKLPATLSVTVTP